MNATVKKAALIRAAGACERAVAQKTSLPILSGLLLEVGEGLLEIAGTDLELALQARCPVQAGAEPGKIAVNADGFMNVIRGLPGADVSFSLDEEARVLHVRSGRSNYKVPVLVASEFPALPAVGEGGASFVTTNAELANVLAKVLPACAMDDTRPVICGVQFGLKGTRLSLVATDTHRLHVARLQIEEPEGGDVEMILGRRPCAELLKLLPSADKPTDICAIRVSFTVTDGARVADLIEVSSTWGVFTARLTAGVFPNWNRVVPVYTNFLQVAKEEFIAAVKRAGVVAEGSAGRLTFEVQEGVLCLHAVSEEFGEADEAVDIQDVSETGEPLHANYRNLLPAVAAIPDDLLTIRRGSPVAPLYLQGSDAESYFAIVMPMQPQ